MTALVVTRWRRYGHDRLYVATADGTRVGHLDLTTGASVLLHDEAYRHAFEVAVAEHLGAVRPAPGSPRESTVPAQAVTPAQPLVPAGPVVAVGEVAPAVAAEDLAQTAPGAAARRQADALRREAPVRTRLARVLGIKTDERSWRIGADAEEAVAKRLRVLGDRWKVLHAVPVGDHGSDVDHVVIGPGGVYTLNTKHHPDASVWVAGDTVMVSGRRVPYVRNSRFEARRVAALLSGALGGLPVTATGLVVVMGAREGFTVKSQPDDGRVVVLTRRAVAGWLGERPVRLTDGQVEALFAVARRPDTWRGPRGALTHS